MRPFRFTAFHLSLATLFFTGFAGWQSLRAEDDPIAIAVADSSTYVSVAKVNLAVGAMSVDHGQLVGTYSIDVPLRKSKSEKGQITLPMKTDLATYLRKGGTLSGEGLADKDIPDKERRIDAQFAPINAETKTGHIHLTIKTSQRVMEFDSTYTLRGASSPTIE